MSNSKLSGAQRRKLQKEKDDKHNNDLINKFAATKSRKRQV